MTRPRSARPLPERELWGFVSPHRRRLTLLAITLAALAYLRVLRPWQLTWGATQDEVDRALPGDDLVERPTLCATRAITIAAPAERIFPWLVQSA